MIKTATDLEQSRKLSEILPKETSDCNWNTTFDNEWNCCMGSGNSKFSVPAWSLTALLKVLRSPILRAYEDGKWFCSAIPDLVKAEKYERMTTDGFDEPVDAVVDLIIRLKEKDLL